MKRIHTGLAAATFVLIASCSAPQNQKPDAAGLRQESQNLTHMLVDKDAVFTNSIKEILPNGVYRETPAESAKLHIKNQSGRDIPASQFYPGLTTTYEVTKGLGHPVRVNNDRTGSTVYSYDATDGSIVTYVFAASGTLTKMYGYHVPMH